MSLATGSLSSSDAPVCADDDASIEAYITAETEALQLELFSSVYGLSWEQAWSQAIAQLPGLLAYAAAWGGDAITVQRGTSG